MTWIIETTGADNGQDVNTGNSYYWSILWCKTYLLHFVLLLCMGFSIFFLLSNNKYKIILYDTVFNPLFNTIKSEKSKS